VIAFRDTVTIRVPAATVWGWLESLPEHITDWHPDHLSARWVSGGAFVPNAVMEVHERLHGKSHRLRMTLTDVEPGHRLRYRVFPGIRGGYDVEPTGTGTRFTATLEIGVHLPVVGAFIDWMLRLSIPARLEAIRRHQAEEAANLKALLETKPLSREASD
jgi:uncharacterized protein YndB with AHSA1/START domain